MQKLRQISGKEKAGARGMACFPIFSKFSLLLFLSVCISAFSVSPNHLSFLSFSVNSFAAHFVFFLLFLSPHCFVIPGKSDLSVLSLLTPFNCFLRLFHLFFPPLCFFSPLSLLILLEFKHCDSHGQQTSLGTEETLDLMRID